MLEPNICNWYSLYPGRAPNFLSVLFQAFSNSFFFTMFTAPNINLVWASFIVKECVRLGLTYFCIAPGSRSSPLAISACSHSLTIGISCFDECSFAFHAVGYARRSYKPAVIITSSGTVVSNLLPAVVEASHDFAPVTLLTADHPPELQDAGANQAIDQPNNGDYTVGDFMTKREDLQVVKPTTTTKSLFDMGLVHDVSMLTLYVHSDLDSIADASRE